jgi:hypothetical protein
MTVNLTPIEGRLTRPIAANLRCFSGLGWDLAALLDLSAELAEGREVGEGVAVLLGHV